MGVPLTGSILQVLARCDRADVLGAALEVLAMFFEAFSIDAEQSSPVVGADAPTSPLASPLPPSSPCDTSTLDMAQQFGAQVRAFMDGTVGLTEKLALLLKDGEGELGESAASAALSLLQHAPRAEVEQHREALAAAALEVEPGHLKI